VNHALRRKLSLVVAETKSKLGCKLVPVPLRNLGHHGRAPADGAAALEPGAGGMGWGFGDVDGVVDPHDAVDGLGMQASSSGGEGRG
jgi:hypothetical protein